MHKISRLLMICATSMLASACASPPPKVQDVGLVVQAPCPPKPVPPALLPPPSYSFQNRLQAIFAP